MESPASESAVTAARTQNVIGTFHKKIAQVHIPGFGDSFLRVMIAGLVAARSQSQIAANVTTVGEPVFVSNG